MVRWRSGWRALQHALDDRHEGDSKPSSALGELCRLYCIRFTLSLDAVGARRRMRKI
jgi:hypothetical protein